MQTDRNKCLIIGAGLTGLSTAHHLTKLSIPFHILEKQAHPGGVIHSVQENGFLYETGPNTGVIGSSEIAELFEDLYPLCELETANEKASKRYILKKGRWEPLPAGILAGIRTPLFSLTDKLRLLGEPFRAPGKDPDETLADLVKRRMGKSFLDYAIDPFIIGVYAGDPNLLITRHALPKLYNLEQQYGSFIKGAIRKGFQKKSPQEQKITRKVFSARGGLSNLVDALYKTAGQENFTFNVQDLEIQPHDKGFKARWQNQGQWHETMASHVIFTGGAHNLAEVFPFIDPHSLEQVQQLQYAKVVEVSLGFDPWQGIPLDGFGGLIPSKEERDILGVLYMSTLFEGRAPENGALLTVFMGGIRNPAVANMSDAQIRQTVEREISDLMQLPGFDPAVFKITRYDYAIPQYDIHSGTRFAAIERLEKQFPGLILGGNMRDGIGMADRVKQGKMLANQILTHTL